MEEERRALAAFDEEIALREQELLPSLPYKVDTSRPSLRTNWTRLACLQARTAAFSPCGRALFTGGQVSPPLENTFRKQSSTKTAFRDD